MKNFGIRKIAVLLFAAMVCHISFVHPVAGYDKLPQPEGAVNDFAGIITPGYARAMELLAREVLEKTGTSIVVVTVKSIGNSDPADYTNRLYETWGIGRKGEDKGILILLALQEKRIRIETGYGVEGILPDGKVGEILDTYAVPYLKKGDYGGGLANAMVALSNVVAKNAGITLTGRPSMSQRGSPRGKNGGSLFSLILLLIIVSTLLGTRQGRAMLPWILLLMLTGGRGGGGGFGGFGGGFGGFGGGMSGGGGAGRGF